MGEGVWEVNMDKKVFMSLLLVAGLTFASCAQRSGKPTTGPSPDGRGMDMDEMFAFGEPADAEEADRQIEVDTLDSFRFEPDAVDVEHGETITFVVTNKGEVDHEFVLGDEAFQEHHAAEMAEGEMDMEHMAEPNTLVVEPGQTEELTWSFSEQGEVLYGCHEPGHYEAGMVGKITVAP